MPRMMRMKRKDALTELSERIGRIERLLLPPEELHWLDGLRVQCIRDGEVGTVRLVWLHRNQTPIQIVVDMDANCTRIFLPRDLSIHVSNFL